MPSCDVCMLGTDSCDRVFYSSVANLCKCPLCGRLNWQFNHMVDRLWDCEHFMKTNPHIYKKEKLRTLGRMFDATEQYINAARDSFGNPDHSTADWIANRDLAYNAINAIRTYAGITVPR